MTWRTATLGELCAEGNGGIQTGPFGSQLHASDYVNEGIPSVMPQNIGDNVIDPAGIARITEEDATRLSRYRLRHGDIVYSRRGDVEKRAYVRAEHDGWLCGTGCLRVRLGDDNDPQFVSYYLGTEDARAWIVRHAVGATMPNLNTAILSGVPMQVPRLPEQRAIAEVLGALDDKIAANTGLISAAAELALALCSQTPSSVSLGEVVRHHKTSLVPAAINEASVRHYSLPAFDENQLPESVPPATIKSSKFHIAGPSVLVSKLNPRFPRLWDVPEVGQGIALASTEFLVLESLFSSSTVLWAIVSQPSFSTSLEAQVAGTSGSHQRVRPADLLATNVADPREISKEVQDSVATLGQRMSTARATSIALADLRDALLPQLMSGKIRIKDIEHVVEEVV